MKTSKPKTQYRLQAGSGNGCAMEPPQHPRYYTKAVYTLGGNSLEYEKAPQYFFDNKWFTELEDVDKYFKPLPLNHPAVRAWIKDLHRHLNSCYDHPTQKEYGDRRKIVIFPVPYYELMGTEAENKAVIEERAAIATPENHSAVRSIREHYPQYQPEADLIAGKFETEGHWYETLLERPTAENCPGEARWSSVKKSSR